MPRVRDDAVHYLPRILQLLQEHGDVQKTFEIMLEEYDVDAEQLEMDINELLEKLVASGLVKIEL